MQWTKIPTQSLVKFNLGIKLSLFCEILDNAQLAGILNDVISNASTIDDVDVEVGLT